ncbi:non-ribosomal peptide synthetase [Actinokineospora sp. NBRC 105648]|uniref:non-ribosomal peptide synthetase n=1 Tax=Actinokineospora sp. NBRC 105648 TaxID=3032206 RepID=UPI0024A5C4F1|nr:non-ribosomal peptide synthetase [Actinokineospora sp. NBRC 105648]GLZ38111.1 hypothetical protein Acsp05_17350 [Actinokineospora sp. NBRC 105648]
MFTPEGTPAHGTPAHGSTAHGSTADANAADGSAAGGTTARADAVADVLHLGRGEPLPDHPRTPVHELVAAFAHSTPDAVAVRSDGVALTYAQLDAWADRVAAALLVSGPCRGERVAVLVPPSVAMVAAVLGVLRAGAAYVPLEAAQPDAKLAAVLRAAGVTRAVVTETTADRLSNVDLVRADTAAHRPRVERPAVNGADTAYVIHTSGSSGEPKGVPVDHARLADSTAARRAVYPGAPVFLLVSPLAFDSSVAGLWGTLTAGGTLVVATADQVRDPRALGGLIAEHGVTHLLCIPSLHAVLLSAGADLSSLRTVILAGEPLPERLLARHFAEHPGVAVVNEYGPTEATVWASYRRYTAPGPVTIGGPVPGARLYVLGEHGDPVPRGVPGELHIGGRGVTDGYLGAPEATAAAFGPDPFADEPGARVYRTGDRVRWTTGGELEFLGRLDHQVKVRGHRIELGEVETALRAAPGVDDAAVVTDGAGTTLVAFAAAGPGATEDGIRAHLAESLAPAARPGRIHLLDRLPVTYRGKVDRDRLRAEADTVVEPTGPAQGTAPAGPDGPVAAVSAAWAQVLHRDQVPPDTNFFDLGGHSLTLFHLQNALEEHTGTRPSVVALYRHTTVTEQARLLAADPTPTADRTESRQLAARRARAVRAQRSRQQRAARTGATREENAS